jgi:hypothetical protein
MAETKTRSKPKAKPAKPKAKARRASSKPKRTRSANGASARRKPKASPSSKSKGLVDKTKAAGETVEETAKDAGRKVGRVAGKAKVPLVAGGAALAGAAGGMAALSARHNHRRRGLGGVNSKDLKKAARKATDVGAQVGEIAIEVRRARERTNGHGAHRSPIEVVLQGLTARRPKD